MREWGTIGREKNKEKEEVSGKSGLESGKWGRMGLGILLLEGRKSAGSCFEGKEAKLNRLIDNGEEKRGHSSKEH